MIYQQFTIKIQKIAALLLLNTHGEEKKNVLNNRYFYADLTFSNSSGLLIVLRMVGT